MNKSYEELVLGKWNFDALITKGTGYGNIFDGFFLFNNSNGVIGGKLYLPDNPAQVVNVGVNGPKVTVSLNGLDIVAEGWFRGPNVITGTFSRSTKGTGQWVASRNEESLTKIDGSYTFEAVLEAGVNKGLQLGGLLQLGQTITPKRPNFPGISPFLDGSLQLNKPNRNLKVTGVANSSEVYLVIDAGNQKILALDTLVTKNVLEGTLYDGAKNRLGKWKATLRPVRPTLEKDWEFKAQFEKGISKGKKLAGTLQLNRSGTNSLSGTFQPDGGGQAQTLAGEISPLGQVIFKMGSYKFTGQFLPRQEKGAFGIVVNTTDRSEGRWGIQIE